MAIACGWHRGRPRFPNRCVLMARILIFCGPYPADLSSGADLRFQNLCKQLAERHESYLVCLGNIPDGIDPRAHLGVVDYKTLPEFPATGRAFLRHLRLTDARFLERSWPGYLADMQASIGAQVQSWNIDALVCLVSRAAEMLLSVSRPKILDCCDSRTLTLQRLLANRGGEMGLRGRLETQIAYFRQEHRERAMVRHFDRITTIADADRACLLEISGAPPTKVVTIPNGVPQAALGCGHATTSRKRSVVFWGNLDFPPNWTAVDFVCREIFLPHLAARNVEWHIIGRGADEELQKLVEHPQIHLHGFVDDLYQEISQHGVMVNPMVEGSGLKNKILEAFACHLPVVSTAMGIEAVGAVPDKHCLVEDDPAAFAEAVIRCLDDQEFAATITSAARELVESRFDWNAIGDQLDEVVSEALR
jgi:glycosyltransferase involved in cell wall biosynthesis